MRLANNKPTCLDMFCGGGEIARIPDLCYNSNCRIEQETGRFAFKYAVTQHNTYCGQSAPYLVDSRPAVRFDIDGSLIRGVLLCLPHNVCLAEKR